MSAEQDLGSPTRIHCFQSDNPVWNYECDVVSTTRENEEVQVNHLNVNPSKERGLQKVRYVDAPADAMEGEGFTVDIQNLNCWVDSKHTEGDELRCEQDSPF